MKLTKLLILFLFLSLKGFSQSPSPFTLKYDKTEFCAGVNEYSLPQIFGARGELIPIVWVKNFTFTYTKKNINSNLAIDINGKLDLSKSSEGEYVVFINHARDNALLKLASLNITVKKCK